MAEVSEGDRTGSSVDAVDHRPATLRREITLPYAVALYLSSVLGAGILITPGLGQVGGAQFLLMRSIPFFSRPISSAHPLYSQTARG